MERTPEIADRDLLTRTARTGALKLPSLTDEELASVHANEGMPIPPPPLRVVADHVRQAVLSTALRGLVVRGLLRPPADAEGGRAATGESSSRRSEAWTRSCGCGARRWR